MKCSFCGEDVEAEMDHYDVCMTKEELAKHKAHLAAKWAKTESKQGDNKNDSTFTRLHPRPPSPPILRSSAVKSKASPWSAVCLGE